MHSWWAMGSLLGLCLTIQLVSGLFLSLHFTANSSLSFSVTLGLTQGINWGWLLRMLHTNGASLFFICLYLHIGRGLYFGSYRLQETWTVGVVLLFLIMGAAFLGYVLPWGQMSFWGATVITSLLTALPCVGEDLVLWLWGGFSVDCPTLTRFFALHFLTPFIASAFAVAHMILLHETGSSNPLGLPSVHSKVPLHPYFTLKDTVGFSAALFLLMSIVTLWPWALGDPENFIPANPLMAPAHIQPEWYFLFAYAILRSIPNKLGGVIALLASVATLFMLPLFPLPSLSAPTAHPLCQVTFWLLVGTIMLLTWIGACPVEAPYVLLGQALTTLYFMLFASRPVLEGTSDWGLN